MRELSGGAYPVPIRVFCCERLGLALRESGLGPIPTTLFLPISCAFANSVKVNRKFHSNPAKDSCKN